MTIAIAFSGHRMGGEGNAGATAHEPGGSMPTAIGVSRISSR